jgi:hypothetical protein
VSLHGKKKPSIKDKKRWLCDKILVHLTNFGPISKCQESNKKQIWQRGHRRNHHSKWHSDYWHKGIGIENKVTSQVVTIDIEGLGDCQQLDACYKHMTLKNKNNCKGIRQHKDSKQGNVALDFQWSQFATTKKTRWSSFKAMIQKSIDP